jgi:hypothetical protein
MHPFRRHRFLPGNPDFHGPGVFARKRDCAWEYDH